MPHLLRPAPIATDDLGRASTGGPNHESACDTCNTRLAMLRSTDAGKTFGTLQVPRDASRVPHCSIGTCGTAH